MHNTHQQSTPMRLPRMGNRDDGAGDSIRDEVDTLESLESRGMPEDAREPIDGIASHQIVHPAASVVLLSAVSLDEWNRGEGNCALLRALFCVAREAFFAIGSRLAMVAAEGFVVGRMHGLNRAGMRRILKTPVCDSQHHSQQARSVFSEQRP
jgi:hypothetical protein